MLNVSPKITDLIQTNGQPVSIKPNLFIIGAMKSGTTFLWSLLASHPSIYLCRPKEPSYFVEPTQLRELQPWLWQQGYWQNQEFCLQRRRASPELGMQSPNEFEITALSMVEKGRASKTSCPTEVSSKYL
jgi:hypothetical protein